MCGEGKSSSQLYSSFEEGVKGLWLRVWDVGLRV